MRDAGSKGFAAIHPMAAIITDPRTPASEFYSRVSVTATRLTELGDTPSLDRIE